ncbi:MAG: rhodanese-like domain-containing protein [Haloarculaceae archaeon]
MVEEITAAQLHERLQRGEPVQVVDVRSRASFEHAHIPGSENLPFAELTRRIDGFDWSDDVVFVCPKGQSSAQAARLLESYEGVDENTTVANMVDGLQNWTYEIETETETEA